MIFPCRHCGEPFWTPTWVHWPETHVILPGQRARLIPGQDVLSQGARCPACGFFDTTLALDTTIHVSGDCREGAVMLQLAEIARAM